MKLSRAEIRTEKAVSYLCQLCQRWSCEHRVEFDDTHGKITLPQGYITLLSSPTMLSVYLEVPSAEDQDSTEAFVAEHLQRLAAPETLSFFWLRS